MVCLSRMVCLSCVSGRDYLHAAERTFMRQMRSGLRLAESRPFAAAVEKGSSDVCSVSGNLEVVKRGRPPIYETDEARKAALKEQMAACHRRYAARVKEARERLAHSNDDTLLKYSAVIND